MDLAAVDVLARFALAERRRGRALRLASVPAELHSLLELTGLAEVLLVQSGRQPEEREERVGVEEERELGDAAV